MKNDPDHPSLFFLRESGEIARLIQHTDWKSTAIGPVDQWPKSLFTVVGMMDNAQSPMLLWWGKNCVQIYNEEFTTWLWSLGKHPTAFGQQGEHCWGNHWNDLSDTISRVVTTGQSLTLSPMTSSAFQESPYGVIDLQPVWQDRHKVGGVLAICQLSTPNVLAVPNPVPVPFQDSAPSGSWIVDLTTRQVQLDSRCKELYGFHTDQQLTYPQIQSLIHPDDVIRLNRIIQWSLAARTGEPLALTYRIIGASTGQLRWLHSIGKARFNALGELTHYEGSTQEVSWEEGTNSELEQIEQRFQSLLDAAPVAICVLRGPSFITEVMNEQMCRLCGRSQTELLDKPIFTAMEELAGQGFEEILRDVLQSGTPFTGNELSVKLQRNGTLQTLFINLSLAPLREVDDLITGITAVVVEVTEQVQARHQVESSAAYLQRLFQLAPTAIGIVRGNRFIIELANPILCTLWGRPEKELLGMPLFDALPEAQGQGYEELLAGVLQTGEPFYGVDLPVTLQRNGQLETVYFEFTYEPFPELSGQIDRIIITAIEATKRVQIQQQTEQLLIQERELNKLKSAFVSMASHEFRTPMATILSSATLIGDYNGIEDRDNRLRHVQRIQSAVHRLTRLLDDFLLITRLEQKAEHGLAQPLNLADFCEEVIDEIKVFLKQGQWITIEHLNGRQTVRMDGHLLKNILINLLSNASKYSSKEKKIQVTTAVQPAEQLILTVSDWGIGIPESDQDKVFSNFFRASNGLHMPGTGLGLYIAKRSVELLGGTISFRSRLGEGTTFTVQLPLCLPL